MKCGIVSKNNTDKSCNQSGVCPCKLGSKKTIGEIVRCFSSNLSGLETERKYYSVLTPDEAISSAGLALSVWAEDQQEARKHPHQFRRKQSTLKKSRHALIKKREEILACTNFDILHEVVEEAISKIEDIGPLMIYDTALRIGMNVGVSPNKVYLHAGTLKGADAIIKVGNRTELQMSDLPEEFRVLDADSIESCLCVCKEQFKALI